MTIETLVNDYKAKTSRSRQMYEEALQVMPGGNSRTTTFFDPYPFYITRGAGARIWDADGTERLDFNGNYTSLILGHAHASVVEAVTEQATRGMSFPGPSEHEVKLAESLTKRIPSMEAVRFVNSGTEATMNAVRAARAFTGRSKIAKFEGAYHGTHDWVLVSVSPDPAKSGSRKRPKPVAYSAGVPDTVLKHTVVLPWNNADACAKILERQGKDIAALIVDPLMANAGLLVPQLGFLERLREVTDRLGIVLIFDEVISFRVSEGGAQERFGILPDLTTLGKIIGGGLAVGAFGGRAEVMNAYDPRGGKDQPRRHLQCQSGDHGGRRGHHEGADSRGLRAARRARRSSPCRRRARARQEQAAGAGDRARLALLDPLDQEAAERLSLEPARRGRAPAAHVPRTPERRRAPDPEGARLLLAGHDRRRRGPLCRDLRPGGGQGQLKTLRHHGWATA